MGLREWRAVLLVLAVCVVFVGAGGCGSDDDDSDESAAATSTAAEPSEGGDAPEDLVGAYEVTLQSSDLPANPAPELTDGPPDWELEIANAGGEDGRQFAISNASLGLLEEPDFEVSGDSIMLLDEECATETGVEFYDNEYQWDLQGESLTFTTVSNSCPDQVAETILTSRPWTRVP